MNTIKLTLDEIYTLARTALLNAGSNEQMANIVADTVMRAEREQSVIQE